MLLRSSVQRGSITLRVFSDERDTAHSGDSNAEGCETLYMPSAKLR
jgi:hypothetical protein